MAEPYRPSNGTEGEMFQEQWCEKCEHDLAARKGGPPYGCLVWPTFIDNLYNSPLKVYSFPFKVY
jgi:hypothetical protein